MDPTANKREQIEIAKRIIDSNSQPGDTLRLAELVLALHNWRERGGFDPEVTDITVGIYRSDTDGMLVVQIDSPEDADYRVNINDGDALRVYDGGERVEVAEHLRNESEDGALPGTSRERA